jgi:hypothetical protein
VLLPVAASAQTSTVAGEVRDVSGAVLPSVTVEVSSPALIEKVRSATTDDRGRYSIVQLRPGVYSITFTLPGFSSVKRDNIELTSDFTASINAELKVGTVEETIIVSAESPVVDVQSITTRTVMTRDILDAIPTGRNIQAVGIMIPGTTLAPGGGGALSRDVGSKDKLSSYHDDQSKYRDHWGISATVPPDASGVQVTPTSFVHVTRWTRTHTNRLLFDAGIGIYDQEYTELYQPEVLNGFSDKVWDEGQIRASRVYSILDTSNNFVSSAWPNPADHFSLLRTGAATKTVQLIREGFEYGDQNLNQLDLRASRRFSFDHELHLCRRRYQLSAFGSQESAPAES